MRSFIAAAAVGASLVSAVPLNSAPFPSASSLLSGSLSTGVPITATGAPSFISQQGSKNKGVGVEILGDNFPFPNEQQTEDIEAGAKGDLSNAPPPPPNGLSQDTKTSIQFVAFNENVEAVFFQELLNNVTQGVSGYTFENRGVKAFIENALEVIVKQEELHSINAENALKAVFGAENQIQPCQYTFPVDNFGDAINLAARFTDVVLGTLPDIIFHAAQDGDAAFTPGVAAALGNEGEQEGWFRTLQGLRPSELPFLTRSTRNFAFSALQDFTIPGSCPNEQLIDLTIFQPFNAVADPPAKTTDIEFTFPLKPTRFVPKGTKTVDVDFVETYGGDKWQNKLFVTYLNQQDLPVSVPVKNVVFDENKEVGTITALFPFDTVHDQQMFGLTIATLTTSDNLTSAAEMDSATILGPALLETIEPSMGKQYN